MHSLDYLWTAIFVIELLIKVRDLPAISHRLPMCMQLTIFVIELLIKVIAFGFVSGRHAYIADPWNQLDLVIVLSSLLVIAAEALPGLRGAPALKALRVLRVLRPLRIVRRISGMRLIVSSLVRALPAASNAFGVMMLVQSVFAILGMQLFIGDLP